MAMETELIIQNGNDPSLITNGFKSAPKRANANDRRREKERVWVR